MARDVTQIKEGETDLEYYHRIAKAADQRMRELERLSQQEGYKSILDYSYRLAQRDAVIFGANPNKPRFDIKPPDNRNLFNEKINDMIRFLQSPTSSKRGIEQVYDRRVNTINEKYGTNFTWQDLKSFMDSGAFDKFTGDAYFSSKTVFKAVGVIQSTMKKLKEGIELDKSKRSDVTLDVALTLLDSRRSTFAKAMGLSNKDKQKIRRALK